MKNPSCLTSTGARNIPSTRSELDAIRSESRTRGIHIVTAFGDRFAIVHPGGAVWYAGSFVDACADAEGLGKYIVWMGGVA